MECTLRNQTTPQQTVGCVLRTMTRYKQPHGLFQHRNGAWNAPYPNCRVRFTHHEQYKQPHGLFQHRNGA